MSEPIKLLPEELTKITEIRKNYFNIQTAVGQIQLSKHNAWARKRSYGRIF